MGIPSPPAATWSHTELSFDRTICNKTFGKN